MNSTPDFTQHPQVINGYSELMIEISGEEKKISSFRSLDAARDFIFELDARFDSWAGAGFPSLSDSPDDQILQDYEGCDLYAVDLDSGEGFEFFDDAWRAM